MTDVHRFRPAWADCHALDACVVARIAHEFAQELSLSALSDSAAISGLAIEAAEVFQRLHFSFDPDYWASRDFPEAVSEFAWWVREAFQSEPHWINTVYVLGSELLIDLLRRHAKRSIPAGVECSL